MSDLKKLCKDTSHLIKPIEAEVHKTNPLIMDRLKHLDNRALIWARCERFAKSIPNAEKIMLYGEHTLEVWFDNVHSKKYKILNMGIDFKELNN